MMEYIIVPSYSSIPEVWKR